VGRDGAGPARARPRRARAPRGLSATAVRLAYVTDQLLPTDATDTIQLVSMAAAFGEAGADLRLVFPCPRARSAPTSADLAAHYGVLPTFTSVPLPGPYPAPLGLRGLEKLAHAGLAMARIGALAPDVIYTRNLPVVLAALAATRLPVVYETYRPWPAQSRAKRALFDGLRLAPRFAGLVLHSALAARSYRALGYDDARLLVAHNGIDPRRFEATIDRDDARRALGLPTDRTLAVYTGHVSIDKGLDLLLDAARALPDLELVIVGSRGDGPIELRARALSNVRVFGWQPPGEIGRWLAAADLLIIPPTRGPLDRVGNTVLPIKTFQYLASGRAIVAPATPDLAEVLRDGDNARLVPPDDPPAFVAALAALVADPALRARLGASGRAAALANTWRARAERILAFVARRARRMGGALDTDEP